MSTYHKPYLSPYEQIDLLVSRGMSITDREKARDCLMRIGYYRLSAYWYPFRDTLTNDDGQIVVGDDFKPDTNFSTSLDLYVFDKKLRLLVMDGLERIEIALRTDISLLLGRHGSESHRRAALLHGNFTKKIDPRTGQTGHKKWLTKLDGLFRDSKEEFVKHFKSRYPDDDLPIWMAVELWDFGMLSHFFAGMRADDKDTISKQYNLDSGQVMESWLRSLNVVRNICAHHSRLWNKPVPNPPKWPPASAAPDLQHVIADPRSHRRFYAAAVMIRHLLLRIHPSTNWGKRMKEVVDLLPDSPYLKAINAGFPDNWQNLALWKDLDIDYAMSAAAFGLHAMPEFGSEEADTRHRLPHAIESLDASLI